MCRPHCKRCCIRHQQPAKSPPKAPTKAPASQHRSPSMSPQATTPKRRPSNVASLQTIRRNLQNRPSNGQPERPLPKDRRRPNSSTSQPSLPTPHRPCPIKPPPTPSDVAGRAGSRARRSGWASEGWAHEKVKPEPKHRARAGPGRAWASARASLRLSIRCVERYQSAR